MLSYELCNQLKDAGFPQDGELMYNEQKEIIQHSFDHCYCPKCNAWDETYYIIPTLSELIEACGEMKELIKNPDNWEAVSFAVVVRESYFSHYGMSGQTPEEAVAKLYLKLHADNGKTGSDG